MTNNINITDAGFNVSFNSESVGFMSFPNVTIETGRSQYNFTVNFTLSNASLLSDILTNYLNGSEIKLLFDGVANGSDVISNVINQYSQEISLPPGAALQYGLGSISLINATNTTLTLNTTLNITNPIPMKVNLTNLLLNVYYSGIRVGNITSASQELSPGSNSFAINITLSSAENKSAVEELLSNHVNGNDINLWLNGSIGIKIDGMQEPINTTYSSFQQLQGIKTTLVEDIKINFITLSASPPSMLANVNVTVNNPFNFDINVTYWNCSVYFDDPDGVNIAFVYSAGAKSNIHVDDVQKTENIKIIGAASQELNANINSNNLDICARLYDEYFIKSQLKIDIRSGNLNIKIGDFSAWVTYSEEDIPVN
ncbi:MAG: hypothetical protein ACTSVI_05050, partial [Promethearchaeota archaeon]